MLSKKSNLNIIEHLLVVSIGGMQNEVLYREIFVLRYYIMDSILQGRSVFPDQFKL